MVKFAVQRVVMLAPVLLGVSLITFVVVRLLPGDVVDMLLGVEVRATPEVAQQIRELLKVDRPIYEQYALWLWRILHGDLGVSLGSGKQVLSELMGRYPVTVELVLLTTALTVVVGIPVGAVSAIFRGRWPDRVGRLLSLVGLSLPSFWVGTLLILLFSVHFRWLPVFGFVPFGEDPVRNLKSMVLPSLTLGLALMASVVRMTRSSMLEVLQQEYITAARSKGLSELVVISRHALKNALIPVLTLLGLQVGALLGGAIIVEAVFSLPGVGTLIVNAVELRDYPVVQGAVLVVTTSAVLVNLAVDLAYSLIDPRIRYG